MKIFYTFLTYIYILSSFFYFEISVINKSLLNIISSLNFLLILLFCLILNREKIFRIRKTYSPIRLFVLLLVISFFSVSFLRDQSIFDSLFSYYPFYSSIIFFFFLKTINFSPSNLKSIVLRLAVFYFLIIFTQTFIFSSYIFGNLNPSDFYNVPRLNVLGSATIIFSLFYSIVNLHLLKNKILFVILVFSIILLQSRTSIALCLLITVYHLFFKNNYKYKFSFVIIFILIGLFLSTSKSYQSLSSNLIEKTEAQSINGFEELQRLTTINYFYEYKSSDFQKIFGNGIASYGKSEFGKKMKYNQENFRLSLDDSSILYFYFYFGVIGLVVIIFYLVSSLRLKVDNSNIYLKYFIVYCLISGCLTYNLSHFSYISIITLSIYSIIYNNKRYLLNKQND